MERSAELLERIGTLIRVERRRSAAEHGLAPAQLDALAYLERANRYSDNVLGVADFLGATKGTTSQTINTLEAKGLVEKRPDPADGRRSHCGVTKQGKRLLASTRPPGSLDAVLDDLDVDLSTDLAQVLRALQRRNGGRSFGVCRSCRHFERGERAQRCGLTSERLTAADSNKICREHEG